MAALTRRKSRQVMVAHVAIGGNAPIVVQSMTNTDTADAQATVRQVAELARAGSEIVRITVNSPEAAAQVATIRERLDAMGCDVPLVGDFHFNGHRLLKQYPGCAEALAKYRINPGNVGHGRKRDDQFSTMIETACRYEKPVRIGVNWGSLDPELLARMMDENGRSTAPLDAAEIMREVGTRLGDGGEGVEGAIRALHALGADVEREPGGGQLSLTGCPVAAAAAGRPRVCGLMAALVGGAASVPVTALCDRGEGRPRCRFGLAAG